jgi:cytochrome c oxidase subunit 3
MDITQKSQKEKTARAKKMMLWFGMVSLIMGFAGWTSAYIVSSSRKDWIENLQLPAAFYISTGFILLSSITYWLAKKSVLRGKRGQASLLLWVTLALGIAFISFQFVGFSQWVEQGFYFTGPSSSITHSYIYLIAMVHILHVVAGLISLMVVLYQHLKGSYRAENILGMELGLTFWHFVDLLWVYLLLFFTFY